MEQQLQEQQQAAEEWERYADELQAINDGLQAELTTLQEGGGSEDKRLHADWCTDCTMIGVLIAQLIGVLIAR